MRLKGGPSFRKKDMVTFQTKKGCFSFYLVVARVTTIIIALEGMINTIKAKRVRGHTCGTVFFCSDSGAPRARDPLLPPCFFVL